MPQYLVTGYLPDDFDPSAQDEAMVEEIHALNREMIAAGVRKFAAGLGSTRTLRRSPTVKCSSPTGRTWKPRSTWAAFGYWKPQTWTRRGLGAQGRQRAVGRARCERFSCAGSRRELSDTATANWRQQWRPRDSAGNRLKQTKKDK